jgi:hypothetical protein
MMDLLGSREKGLEGGGIPLREGVASVDEIDQSLPTGNLFLQGVP